MDLLPLIINNSGNWVTIPEAPADPDLVQSVDFAQFQAALQVNVGLEDLSTATGLFITPADSASLSTDDDSSGSESTSPVDLTSLILTQFVAVQHGILPQTVPDLKTPGTDNPPPILPAVPNGPDLNQAAESAALSGIPANLILQQTIPAPLQTSSIDQQTFQLETSTTFKARTDTPSPIPLPSGLFNPIDPVRPVVPVTFTPPPLRQAPLQQSPSGLQQSPTEKTDSFPTKSIGSTPAQTPVVVPSPQRSSGTREQVLSSSTETADQSGFDTRKFSALSVSIQPVTESQGTSSQRTDTIPAPPAIQQATSGQQPSGPETDRSPLPSPLNQNSSPIPQSAVSPPAEISPEVPAVPAPSIQDSHEIAPQTQPVAAVQPDFTPDSRDVLPLPQLTALPQSNSVADASMSSHQPAERTAVTLSDRQPDQSEASLQTPRIITPQAPVAPEGFIAFPGTVTPPGDLGNNTIPSRRLLNDEKKNPGDTTPDILSIHQPPPLVQNFEKPVAGSLIPIHADSTFVPQLTQAVTASISESQQIRVELSPEGLGQIQIEVSRHEGKLTARIEVEHPATQHLVTENLGQLRESLGHQGISVEKIEVVSSPFHSVEQQQPGFTSGDRENSRSLTQQERQESREWRRDQPQQEPARRDAPRSARLSRNRIRNQDLDVTI